MDNLFSPGVINGMSLANRFVRSATWEGLATEEGAVTSRLTDLMVRLADGGVGLIITGHAYVSKQGQAGPRQLGVYSDDLVPGLREMVRSVHDRGGRIVLQLAHSGIFARRELTGRPPLALSDIGKFAATPPMVMTNEDIDRLVAAFARASRRAVEAGFDGVQIHAAHGYLLSQSLSPLFNHRTDAYGGTVRNRARLLLRILRAVRKTTGPDYPVLVKMNTSDFEENGLSVEDAVSVGVFLEAEGINAIELSGGLLTSARRGPARVGIHSEEKEAYFRDGATAFRKKVRMPLILVGGIRSYPVARRLVTDGTADYISMSRPLIREPGLIKRWKAGDLKRAACLSDNRCFQPAREGEGVYCVTEKRGV